MTTMSSDENYTPEEREMIAEIRKLGAETILVIWDRQLICYDASAVLRSGKEVRGQDAHRTAAIANLLNSVRTGNAAS